MAGREGLPLTALSFGGAPEGVRGGVDGGAPDSVRVVPEGARQDRPLYVFREVGLESGEHEVAVLFTSEDGAGATLQLAERFRVGTGEVVLVTTSADGGMLLRRGGRGTR